MSDLVERLDRFLRQSPALGRSVFVAPSAVLVGAVSLGDHSSVWHHAVLRGDINCIVVGHHTNLQDHAVLHVANDFSCQVGNFVTVGHSAILHACTIHDEVLVGMGATILDGAVIGANSLVAASALVARETKVPPGSLVVGSPARVIRALTAAERAEVKAAAEKYVELAAYCLQHELGNPKTPPAPLS